PLFTGFWARGLAVMWPLPGRRLDREAQPTPPPTLRDAVWLPLAGMLRRHRAVEILAFVVLYKLGDPLTQSLTRPCLIDMGYDAVNRGIALATLSVVFTILGTFAGGFVTTLAALARALLLLGV